MLYINFDDIRVIDVARIDKKKSINGNTRTHYKCILAKFYVLYLSICLI